MKSILRQLAPRSTRAHRILRGQLRGRIIVTSVHDYPAAILGRTESALLAWFQRNIRPGETWLDIGAHYGYTTIALAELVGPRGHVYAFEPSLTVAGNLNQTKALNGLGQIIVVPFGLAEPGDIRVISVPIDRGMANHAFGGTSTEDIYVIGFDNLWSALGERPVHGAKIDVQGMELKVIEGMMRTLQTHHPKLVVEFHPGVDRRRILELLTSTGYQTDAIPLQPLPSETQAMYVDDHSYVFEPT